MLLGDFEDLWKLSLAKFQISIIYYLLELLLIRIVSAWIILYTEKDNKKTASQYNKTKGKKIDSSGKAIFIDNREGWKCLLFSLLAHLSKQLQSLCFYLFLSMLLALKLHWID